MDIEKSYELVYPVARVYKAWVSSDTVIAPATRMDIDPVEGGHYRLYVDGPDFFATNEGFFLEVIPEKFLRYSWQWQGHDETTEIAVRFTATPAGTRIDIKHSGFTSQESLTSHDKGWDSYLEGLRVFLGPGLAKAPTPPAQS